MSFGFRVQGMGSRVRSFGSRVQGSVLTAQGSGFGTPCPWFRVVGLGVRVQDYGRRVQVSGFLVCSRLQTFFHLGPCVLGVSGFGLRVSGSG